MESSENEFHRESIRQLPATHVTVASTQSEMTEIILPNDTNTLGNLLGGRLMHFIDLTGAMAAYRHARTHVVTAAMDHIDFIRPVHLGDLLTLRSSVNRAFTTSMEVGVKVWAENTSDRRAGARRQRLPGLCRHRQGGPPPEGSPTAARNARRRRRFADALLPPRTPRGRDRSPQAGAARHCRLAPSEPTRRVSHPKTGSCRNKSQLISKKQNLKNTKKE